MKKRAGEKIFSLWWFVCLALVGIIVVMVTVNYFSSPIDVRPIEIAILQEKIFDCAVKNSYLKEEVLSWDREELFENCGLNEETFKEEKNALLFFHLRIKNESGIEIKKFRFGQFSYEEECLTKQKGPHFPACSETKLLVNYFNEEKNKKENFILELLVASQNHGTKKSFIEENEKK